MSLIADRPVTPAQAKSRWRFPLFALLLAAVAIIALWAIPGDFPRRMHRVFYTQLSVVVAVLTLLVWLVGFSMFSWTVRLLFPLAFFGVVYGAVEDVRFDGDMGLCEVIWRWQKAHDDVVDTFWKDKALADGKVDLAAERASDFPEYRGHKRDGVATGPPLNRDWHARPPARVWPVQPVGIGHAACAVAGNLLVTIEQRHDDEAIVAYDTATGKVRWKHQYPAHFKEKLGGPGPRATPTIAGKHVYSLGATGMLVCLDALDGKMQWTVDILEDNDNIMWGMSGSPLVYDNVVVVNAGCQRQDVKGRGLVAYDRATGLEVWKAGDAKAGYSSPMLATLGGRRQVLILDAGGLAGHDATTGKELWRYPWTTYQDINVAQPLVIDDNRVYICSGYGVGGAMLRVEEKEGTWSAQPLWKNNKLCCKFTSPVLYKGHIYGLHEDLGVLVCLDAETGKQKWRDGRYKHGQLLRSQDLLVILSEDGELVLVEASPESHRELGKVQAVIGRTWNLPALADGKAYVRNEREMTCFDLR